MGREVRFVPDDWKHPKNNGLYSPLSALEMPQFADGEATHMQLYEINSKGTPISPVMATPETLAQWLVDNNVTAYHNKPVSYAGWLVVCKGLTKVHRYETGESKAEQQDAFSKIDQGDILRNKKLERD